MQGTAFCLRPSITLTKAGQALQGGAVLPLPGQRKTHGRPGACRLAARTPLLKLGVGVTRRPRPPRSCHCWSERERAARAKNFLQVQTGDKDRDGEGGGGEPQGGQSCRQPDGTGPRPQPRNLSLHQPEAVAQGPAVPTPGPLSGLLLRPPWGAAGSALPRERTHGGGGGAGEEHGVITFQRNEVRAPLFPI